MTEVIAAISCEIWLNGSRPNWFGSKGGYGAGTCGSNPLLGAYPGVPPPGAGVGVTPFGGGPTGPADVPPGGGVVPGGVLAGGPTGPGMPGSGGGGCGFG